MERLLSIIVLLGCTAVLLGDEPKEMGATELALAEAINAAGQAVAHIERVVVLRM